MKKTLTNPSFISLLSSYTSFIKVRNYKIGKRDNYQSAVSDFLIWLEVSGISKIKEVTSKESVAYFEHLITRPKMRGDGTLAVYGLYLLGFTCSFECFYSFSSCWLRSALILALSFSILSQ